MRIFQLTKTEAIVFYGIFINLLLGIFNMVPAFPLDGGRVLRSILAKVTGDFLKATRISTTMGIIFSYFFMGLGAVSLFAGNYCGRHMDDDIGVVSKQRRKNIQVLF